MLSPLISKTNIKGSLKKYFIDNVGDTEGIPVTFDGTIDEPPREGANRWLIIDIGPLHISGLSSFMIKATVCTQEDNEGIVLASTYDAVMKYLLNDDKAVSQDKKRVPLYEVPGWERIGTLMVDDVDDSGEQSISDLTKYQVLMINLKFFV